MRRVEKLRFARSGLLLCFVVFVLYLLHEQLTWQAAPLTFGHLPVRPERYPSQTQIRLPRGRARAIPRIQHEQPAENRGDREIRESRLTEVREAFLHAWDGYKSEAWAEDELKPISGGFKTPFCGWSATLVDTLDTLWIMGLKEEFEMALVEVEKLDFTGKEHCQINLFETTIRHLGGLLAAYDISGGIYTILLDKAVELAEVLYTAFDTPNRMPAPHYVWSATDSEANNHRSSSSVVVAVLGSLSIEFTRLSQLTNQPKYYSAVQNVMDELEKWQMQTALPGLWPAKVDATNNNGIGALSSASKDQEIYTLGSFADSTYEYLGKQFMMLGGRAPQYRTMYENFVEVAKEHLMFRPMTIEDRDILIPGILTTQGGMLAIAGRIFGRDQDVDVGRKLTDGCVWAYQNTMTGIMPENFDAVPCADKTECHWDQKVWFDAVAVGAEEDQVRLFIEQWKLSPGFASIGDKRYLLRPEAIESVFIMYRITAEPRWQSVGWDMFKSIIAHTKTRLAHSAIDDVTSGAPRKIDEMESFWLAETLKYFYLLFSEFDVVSLDEYVLNTEAHPLRRPK